MPLVVHGDDRLRSNAATILPILLMALKPFSAKAWEKFRQLLVATSVPQNINVLMKDDTTHCDIKTWFSCMSNRSITSTITRSAFLFIAFGRD
jgi:hypothetical protein